MSYDPTFFSNLGTCFTHFMQTKKKHFGAPLYHVCHGLKGTRIEKQMLWVFEAHCFSR